MVMKKLCLALILIPVLLCAACAPSTVESTTEPKDWTEGICLVTGGTVVLIADGSPIVLHDQSEQGGLLEKLQTGDHIRVQHGPVMESYPAQTQVFALEYQGPGSLEEVPQQTLDQLRGLGWLD